MSEDRTLLNSNFVTSLPTYLQLNSNINTIKLSLEEHTPVHVCSIDFGCQDMSRMCERQRVFITVFAARRVNMSHTKGVGSKYWTALKVKGQGQMAPKCNHFCGSPQHMFTPLASCLIYAWAVPAHPLPVTTSMLIWVRSFIEPDLFENNVPFDNTTPIYLINLLRKLGLTLGINSPEMHCFGIFCREWLKRAPCLMRISWKVTSC